jgi:hypothetical protein
MQQTTGSTRVIRPDKGLVACIYKIKEGDDLLLNFHPTKLF